MATLAKQCTVAGSAQSVCRSANRSRLTAAARRVSVSQLIFTLHISLPTCKFANLCLYPRVQAVRMGQRIQKKRVMAQAAAVSQKTYMALNLPQFVGHLTDLPSAKCNVSQLNSLYQPCLQAIEKEDYVEAPPASLLRHGIDDPNRYITSKQDWALSCAVAAL